MSQGEDERQPCIAHFGRKYVAGWTDPRPGGTRIEFQNIELDSLARCGGGQFIDVAGRPMSMAAITGQRESGKDSSMEGIVTHREYDVGTGGAVIDSRRYRSSRDRTRAAAPAPGSTRRSDSSG